MSADYVSRCIDEHRSAVDALAAIGDQVAAVGSVLVDVLQAGGRVFLCGNGGSAADAQHIAAEMTGRFETERPGLPASALTVDSSAMTAISNDYGFDRIFARQVEALARPGDCLIGISTSGTSGNVVTAVEAAKAAGVTTIGLAGRDGGTLASLCDHCLTVPHAVTARIQECHILIGHIWCGMIDEACTP